MRERERGEEEGKKVLAKPLDDVRARQHRSTDREIKREGEREKECQLRSRCTLLEYWVFVARGGACVRGLLLFLGRCP